MKEWMQEATETLADLVWGPWTIVLFIGVGVFFSMRLRWMQITKVKEWMYESVGKYLKRENRHDLSGLKSVCTLLAATIGTGNLAGVATALIAGGPGTIFWMWIAAILGMTTAFAENALGIMYRSKQIKGPMAYIRHVPGGRALAKMYAALCLLCGFGMGNLAQSNTAAIAMKEAFNIHPLFVAVLFMIVLGAVFSGGRSVAGKVTLAVTPFMALIFLIAAFWILGTNYRIIPGAVACIFREAFRMEAAAGGVMGYGLSVAMRYGVSRGVFTNEAGIGTSVFANEQNENTTPKQQGYTAIFAVFADTIVMCTLTALILLVSGVYDTNTYSTAWITGEIGQLPDGAALLVQAFEKGFGEAGGDCLAVLTLIFAFSTLLAWSQFAWQACSYLTKGKGKTVFQFCFLAAVGIGTFAASQVVWELSDVINGGMAVINIFSILVLSVKLFEYHERNVDENKKK